MPVCSYDCSVRTDETVTCSEILGTDPSVSCSQGGSTNSWSEMVANLEFCSIEGGQIYTTSSVDNPVQAPNGDYCHDTCLLCGYGEIEEVNENGKSYGIGEYYTSQNDCIKCSDPDKKLVLDYSKPFPTGSCEDESFDYQADLPVPEQCECTYTWMGCEQHTGPRDQYKDMTSVDCKAEIREKVESYLKVLATIVLFICGGFAALLFFTAIAIDIWRDEEDDTPHKTGTELPEEDPTVNPMYGSTSPRVSESEITEI